MARVSRHHHQLRTLLLLVWLASAGLLAVVAEAQLAGPPTEPLPPSSAIPESPESHESPASLEPAAVAATPASSAATEPTDTAASQQLVAFAIEQFGRNSLQAAEAYADLADAQRRSGEHEAAAESYLAAVEVYRTIDGTFTPLAIGPLTSLGDNYHEANDYLRAVSAYSEARNVSRRVFGLLNEGQIVLLDRVSRSLVQLDQMAEADQQQVEALRLVSRNYPPESDEALAAIYKYAGWLRDRGLYQLERDQYSRALRIIREHYGREDPRQAVPLVGIGNTFRSQRIPEGQGFGAIRDALDLLLRAPEQDPRAIASVLRDLGDWEVAFNRLDYDGDDYRRAWEFLGQVSDGEQLRREWFGGAAYVLREPLSLRNISDDPNAPPGHVTVRFDLDPTGLPTNVGIIESVPPGLKDEALLRHIRRSRFRPHVANGEVVAAANLALRFDFRYTLDALAAPGP